MSSNWSTHDKVHVTDTWDVYVTMIKALMTSSVRKVLCKEYNSWLVAAVAALPSNTDLYTKFVRLFKNSDCTEVNNKNSTSSTITSRVSYTGSLWMWTVCRGQRNQAGFLRQRQRRYGRPAPRKSLFSSEMFLENISVSVLLNFLYLG